MADQLDDGQNREQLSLIKPEGYQVYTRRWLMLAIFAIFAMSNYFLWAQYAAISDTVAMYYDVSMDIVDMLSIVNLITYVVAILPVMWLTERCNLKVVLVLGSLLQCIGSWIRYAGTAYYSISLNFVGQIICALGQPCCFGMSSQMAGTWFGIGEVSLANGIGFAAVEIGVGLSIAICPEVVKSGSDDMDHQMKALFLYTAVAVTTVLPLTVLVFEASPPLPPSRPKMNVAAAGKQVRYYLSLKVLFLNRNFLFILAANTFNLGFLSLIAFKLNETIMLAFSEENSSEIVQYIGVTKIISCVFGPLAAGYWLDRSKRFRGTTIGTSLFTTISIACFTVAIYITNSVFVVMAMALYWFVAACMIIVVFEYAVELTYPEPEIMSSGLLNASGYGFACFMMLFYDLVLEATNVYATMSMFCVSLFIAFLFTLFINPDYRRQEADRDNFEDVNVSESDTEITNQ